MNLDKMKSANKGLATVTRSTMLSKPRKMD